MSEARHEDPVAPAAWSAAVEGDAAKDSWDVLFERLGDRRLFKLSLAVLALLYALAIYAPLLASDRPYVLEAVDYGAYEQARRGLFPVAVGLDGLLRQTPEAYREGRVEGSTQTYEQALDAEVDALAARLATLATYLPDERAAGLDDLLDRADEAAAEARAAPASERALALGTALKASARDVRDALVPRRPGAADSTDATGVDLRAARSYPLFESIGGVEVGFMFLWLFVLSWPLWNRVVNRRFLGGSRARIRRWRARKVAVALGVAFVVGALWQVLVGGELAFHVAPYKRALTRGDIVATRAVFPPLAFGFAETNLAELYRPPTWTDGGRTGPGGYRAPRPEGDAVTGFVEDVAAIEVRYAEPERDSPYRHLLGTDGLGRDLLVRALWGGRVSLSVGLVSSAILMVIGILVGSLAGYFGGRVDLVVSRVIEVVLCFPVFFLILVVVAFVGPSVLNIMLVIGALRWTGVARLCRAELLRLKELDFVVAARAQGLSTRRILLRHLLPNAMGPLIVAGTFAVAAGILIESSLSFLGFGIQLPIPSWGALVNDSREASHWWIQLFPGLLIFVTVVCYNLVGDAIRDAMDPKMKV